MSGVLLVLLSTGEFTSHIKRAHTTAVLLYLSKSRIILIVVVVNADGVVVEDELKDRRQHQQHRWHHISHTKLNIYMCILPLPIQNQNTILLMGFEAECILKMN